MPQPFHPRTLPEMPAEPTIETLRGITDAFNRHDLDAIMANFAPNAVVESPRGPDPWVAAYDDDDHFLAGDRDASEWTLNRHHHRG